MAVNATNLKLNKDQETLVKQQLNLARNRAKGNERKKVISEQKKKLRLKILITFLGTLLVCAGGFVGGYYGIQYSQNHSKNVATKIENKVLG